MHTYLCSALQAWFECVLCVTQMLGLLDCQRLDGQMVVLVSVWTISMMS